MRQARAGDGSDRDVQRVSETAANVDAAAGTTAREKVRELTRRHAGQHGDLLLGEVASVNECAERAGVDVGESDHGRSLTHYFVNVNALVQSMTKSVAKCVLRPQGPYAPNMTKHKRVVPAVVRHSAWRTRLRLRRSQLGMEIE